jgi:hypothetical protein
MCCFEARSRLIPQCPQHAGTTCSESAIMTVPLLTMMVLIVAFGAEVGWLCRC